MKSVSKELFPIKAHYFFFFASVSPLLPQINVFGKQLGVSPEVMGTVTGVLPIFWALAKPGFGLLVDYFQRQRKLIFIGLIVLMNCSYCCLYFLRNSPEPVPSVIINISNESLQQTAGNPFINIKPLAALCDRQCPPELVLTSMSCGWTCVDNIIQRDNTTSPLPALRWNFYIKNEEITDMLHNNLYYHNEYNFTGCEHLNLNNNNETDLEAASSYKCSFKSECPSFSCALLDQVTLLQDANFTISTQTLKQDEFFYSTPTFWIFVILICIGTVAYNVANSISDAICFDILGADRSSKYGYQRAWGTIGYGITALAAGWAVDWFSGDSLTKDFTPAFIITIVFTFINLHFCRKLELPKLPQPEGALKTLSILLSRPKVVVFLCFAVVIGMFDSFIIYYMFWFIEELAAQTDQMSNIKLLEGATIAAESFVGELIFFIIAGKIIKYFGFGVTLTFSLTCYGLRLLFISLITNPWQILFIELIMQGPTYALTYSTIVAYAAVVAPPGLSATLQGILAGMDDGLGFALGSFLGGISYKYLGGRGAFQLFGILAFASALIHAILVMTVFKNCVHKEDEDNVQAGSPESDVLLDKSLAGKIVVFSSLEEDEKKLKQNKDSVTSDSNSKSDK